MILVTGGTGFIGARLVRALCAMGCHVKVLSRKQIFKKSLGAGTVEYIKCDLLDPHSLASNYIEDCSVVFNCAGELHDETVMTRLHVGGTRDLINSCKEVAKSTGSTIHWVQLSSVGAYGPPIGSASAARFVTEDTVPCPVGAYEATKTQADEIVMEAAEDDLFSYSILRPSNVYGAEMPNNSLRQWASLIKRRVFFFVGRPGAISTYVHVDDVISALLLCGFDPRAKNEIFNLSNDCTQEQMVSAMAKALNISPPWLRLPEWSVRLIISIFSGFKGFPLSSSRVDALVARTRYPAVKLKSLLEYEPSHDVVDTIGEVICGTGEVNDAG